MIIIILVVLNVVIIRSTLSACCGARLEEVVPAAALEALMGDVAELQRAVDDDRFCEELRASRLVRPRALLHAGCFCGADEVLCKELRAS